MTHTVRHMKRRHSNSNLPSLSFSQTLHHHPKLLLTPRANMPYNCLLDLSFSWKRAAPNTVRVREADGTAKMAASAHGLRLACLITAIQRASTHMHTQARIQCDLQLPLPLFFRSASLFSVFSGQPSPGLLLSFSCQSWSKKPATAIRR